MQQLTCIECAQKFLRPSDRGKCPTICSRACESRRRYRIKIKPNQPIRVCRWDGCSVPVGPKKWCDGHRAAVRRLSSNRPSSVVCGVEGCDRPNRARHMCRMHYRRWEREAGRIKAEPWNDRRRDNYHARRARMAGAKNGDRALLSEIVQRDGTACAGCHREVDLSISWPDPMSKSIDHTVPISRGGEHSLANTRLMHLGCNSSKGARVA